MLVVKVVLVFLVGTALTHNTGAWRFYFWICWGVCFLSDRQVDSKYNKKDFHIYRLCWFSFSYVSLLLCIESGLHVYIVSLYSFDV